MEQGRRTGSVAVSRRAGADPGQYRLLHLRQPCTITGQGRRPLSAQTVSDMTWSLTTKRTVPCGSSSSVVIRSLTEMTHLVLKCRLMRRTTAAALAAIAVAAILLYAADRWRLLHPG